MHGLHTQQQNQKNTNRSLGYLAVSICTTSRGWVSYQLHPFPKSSRKPQQYQRVNKAAAHFDDNVIIVHMG